MIKNLFMVIGFFHLAMFLFGALGLCHYRVYIGMKDMAFIEKAEYEQLKEAAKHD